MFPVLILLKLSYVQLHYHLSSISLAVQLLCPSTAVLRSLKPIWSSSVQGTTKQPNTSKSLLGPWNCLVVLWMCQPCPAYQLWSSHLPQRIHPNHQDEVPKMKFLEYADLGFPVEIPQEIRTSQPSPIWGLWGPHCQRLGADEVDM